MSQRIIEFLIDEVIIEGETCLIFGVCNKGPIFLGDVFSWTYKLARKYGEDGFTETRSYQDDVDLKILEINVYRQSLEEISTGLSGELRVMGTGQHKLQAHNMLGNVASFRENQIRYLEQPPKNGQRRI